MKQLKLGFVALVVVGTLLVPCVAQANARPVRGSSAAASSGTQPLKWLADQIALTKINLSPGTKRLVNSLIKMTTPTICPLVAKLAAPGVQAFVEKACLDIGASADPWTGLKTFVPILCNDPSAIFPDYASIFKTACAFLV